MLLSSQVPTMPDKFQDFSMEPSIKVLFLIYLNLVVHSFHQSALVALG